MNHRAILTLLLTCISLPVHGQSLSTGDQLSECHRNADAWGKDVDAGVIKPSGTATSVLLQDFRTCVTLLDTAPERSWPKGLAKADFLAVVWKAIALVEQGRIQQLQGQLKSEITQVGALQHDCECPVILRSEKPK